MKQIDVLACCEKLGMGAACVVCGVHAHFDVAWLIPQPPREVSDNRTACSMRCALKANKEKKS